MTQRTRRTYQISISLALLILTTLACKVPDAVSVLIGAAAENCFPVSRDQYERDAVQLGITPQEPMYPEGAIFEVCQIEGQTTSVRMTDGKRSDQANKIPVGTYSGESTFYTTLENDVDNSFLEPVCSENTVQIVIGSEGSAQGELRSICYSNRDTDNEEMRTTQHSDVTGVIQGELLKNEGQLSIAYNWHSYFTSPQWDSPSLDKTVEFDFLYNVSVSNGVMTLTPAAEVEDYYSLVLTKK